jgi:hypothetical protein
MRRLPILAVLVFAAGIGIAAAQAPADKNAVDTDFLFRLGLMEGHLMVGHELVKAKQAPLALPHYSHPVKELYDDMTPYLKAKKFTPFDNDLIALEAAVTAAPDAPATETKYQTVIATIHKARALAPAPLRASLPEMIKVCASTIDAASGEYGEALEQDKIASVVEYHDSRGYLEWVAQQVKELKAAHADAASQALIDRFSAVLAKAQAIVADLLPAPTPKASLADYRAIAAEAREVARK